LRDENHRKPRRHQLLLAVANSASVSIGGKHRGRSIKNEDGLPREQRLEAISTRAAFSHRKLGDSSHPGFDFQSVVGTPGGGIFSRACRPLRVLNDTATAACRAQ